MHFMRLVAWMSWMGMMVLNPDMVCGQGYPGKPIRIVTAEYGGGLDFTARVIAQSLAANLGQQVIVVNQGGSGGTAATQIVAESAPDGYTLLFYNGNIWLTPFLRDRTYYDPARDFAPIIAATRSPNLLVVHPSIAAHSVQELIALAKAKPGELNYASVGTGSSIHLAWELFKSMAGVNIVHVPYKGAGSVITGLLGGQVQLTFASTAAVAGHIKSGKLRALAVTSLQPSALTPGVPPVAAAVPGFESVSMHGMFAPSKTPAPVISRLNQEIVKLLNQPDVKEKLFNSGLEIVGSSPGELTAMMKSEMVKLGKVIKDADIKAE